MKSSQNELRKATYYGFRNFKHGIISEMKNAFIAKVIKYDKQHHTADLLPLVNLSDGQTSAQLLDVPVAESCYILDELLDRLKPDFKNADSNSYNSSSFTSHLPAQHLMRAGVPVICVVLDRDLDNWDGTTKTFSANSSRMHDMNDSIVIAVLGGDAVNG